MKRDFKMLFPDKKYDKRMKAMSFFNPWSVVELEVDATPWNKVDYIIDYGTYQHTEEENKQIYFENGGDGVNPIDLPLFID